MWATLAAARAGERVAAGAPAAAALADGYHLAFAGGAGLTVVAAVVAAVTLRPRPEPAAEAAAPTVPAAA